MNGVFVLRALEEEKPDSGCASAEDGELHTASSKGCSQRQRSARRGFYARLRHVVPFIESSH